MEHKTRAGRAWTVLVAALVLFVAAVPTVGADPVYKPGVYRAVGQGHSGEIAIKVTFDKSKIVAIEIERQTETSGAGEQALKDFAAAIVAGQNLDVDAVTGATSSSDAIAAAVALCVAQAGGDAAPLHKAGAAIVATEKLDADVVVIGAGASGVSAAIAAADKGAKVILVEKTGVIGGASNFSWAGRFFNSSAAVKAGQKLDLDKKVSDWIVSNHWKVDAADVRQYFARSGETYEWLASKGYATMYLNFFGDQLHILPAYESRQTTLRKMLAASVEKNGGRIITGATAKKLLTDASGRVTGVQAESKDRAYEVRAKAVVMATGGYAGNADMVKKASGYEGPLGGLSQNVGEGLKMAWAVGAEVPRNFGVQMVHQTLTDATPLLMKTYSPFEASFPLMLTYLPSLLNVGPSGVRFRDESAVLSPDASAITSTYNGPYHLVIVSQSQLNLLATQGMKGLRTPMLPAMPPEFYLAYKDQFTLDTPWKNVGSVLDAMVALGQGFKGDTAADLAKKAGLDVGAFTKEVAAYDAATKAGVDDAFGKAAPLLVPLGQGPYYAIVAQINNLGSVGGLTVNKSFQVLNAKHLPVPGLYAVGLDSEGVLFGDAYIGMGDGVGYAFTSGRLGGESAATAK